MWKEGRWGCCDVNKGEAVCVDVAGTVVLAGAMWKMLLVMPPWEGSWFLEVAVVVAVEVGGGWTGMPWKGALVAFW